VLVSEIVHRGVPSFRTATLRLQTQVGCTVKRRALATRVQQSSVSRAVCAARSVPKELAAVKTPSSISLDRAMFAFEVAIGHAFALG